MSRGHIAGVVREGRFSAHMIDDATELVFMDEWTSDSLCCEDAKRILQGSYLKFTQMQLASLTLFKSKTKLSYDSLLS